MLAEHRQVIDHCFAAETIADITARLDALGGEWAASTSATLGRLSPQSLDLTLALLRWGGSTQSP